MRTFSILFSVLILLFYACGNDGNNGSNSDDGYQTYVNASSGDDYTHNGASYFNIPFNSAAFRKIKNEHIECAILSKRLNPRAKPNVRPIAMLSYEENNVAKHCIIATPMDSSLISVEISNFSDFMVKNAPIRNIIELWQLNKCGLGCAKLIGWKDENATQLFLERQTNQ